MSGRHGQVSAHDDKEIVPVWDFGPEKVCVLDGLGGRVDGTRADDDEETIILAGEDPCSREAGRSNGGEGALGRDDLVAEEGGLYEGIVLEGEGAGRKKRRQRGEGDKM